MSRVGMAKRLARAEIFGEAAGHSPARRRCRLEFWGCSVALAILTRQTSGPYPDTPHQRFHLLCSSASSASGMLETFISTP